MFSCSIRKVGLFRIRSCPYSKRHVNVNETKETALQVFSSIFVGVESEKETDHCYRKSNGFDIFRTLRA